MSETSVGTTLGYIVDEYGVRLPGRLRVPVLFDGIPDLPKVVEVGRDIYVLKGTAPTTYAKLGKPVEAILE